MTDIENLFNQYRQKGILIDTNILLLYFVGAVNRNRITKFNRTERFTPEDFDLLQRLLDRWNTIITTPNILTEVSNLINQLGDPERSACFALLAQSVSVIQEQYIESQAASNCEKFTKFGLTDCGILTAAKNRYLVLTDDFNLAAYLQDKGIDTVNFNHLRPYGWS